VCRASPGKEGEEGEKEGRSGNGFGVIKSGFELETGFFSARKILK